MRIVMVCTGNICRSPMAEALMREALKARGREDIEVVSAGVFAYDGDAASYEAVEVMDGYGLDIARHRSQPMTKALAKDSLILGMTGGHKRSVQQLAPGARVYTIGEYAGTGRDVADPYGRGLQVYSQIAKEIKEAVDLAADRIIREY